MKIIFFGTPDYVVPLVSDLYKHYEVVGVVTQPPLPVGRQQFKKYSPVDDWAHKRKIPIFFDFAKPMPEAGLGVCAAYGKIIPESIIRNFKFGILNIHPSLLPKYRGTAPISAAIIDGEKETGVSIIKMDEKVDHGPIITQFKEEINNSDTTATLRERLFERSVKVLAQLIPAYTAGKAKPKEQDHSKATFTKILKRQDGFIDLSKVKPETAERFVRAMLPWPGAWTTINLQIYKSANDKSIKKRIKILQAHIEKGKLILDRVQLEGKNEVSWKQFKEGYPKADFR